jgi:hypothetical protein
VDFRGDQCLDTGMCRSVRALHRARVLIMSFSYRGDGNQDFGGLGGCGSSVVVVGRGVGLPWSWMFGYRECIVCWLCDGGGNRPAV